MPMFRNVDLSITQDLFHNLGGQRNGFQLRLDILNFGNMLNSNWGVGQRVIRNTILASPQADAAGALSYTMQNVSNQLMTKTFESTSGILDVYQFMISFRYSFN